MSSHHLNIKSKPQVLNRYHSHISTWYPSPQEVKAGGSGIQSQPSLIESLSQPELHETLSQKKGAEYVACLECWPHVHKTLCFITALHKPCAAVHTSSPSAQELEAGSKVQDHLQMQVLVQPGLHDNLPLRGKHKEPKTKWVSWKCQEN